MLYYGAMSGFHQSIDKQDWRIVSGVTANIDLYHFRYLWRNDTCKVLRRKMQLEVIEFGLLK